MINPVRSGPRTPLDPKLRAGPGTPLRSWNSARYLELKLRVAATRGHRNPRAGYFLLRRFTFTALNVTALFTVGLRLPVGVTVS